MSSIWLLTKSKAFLETQVLPLLAVLLLVLLSLERVSLSLLRLRRNVAKLLRRSAVRVAKAVRSDAAVPATLERQASDAIHQREESE